MSAETGTNASSQDAVIANTEQKLQEIIQTLLELGITVYDFQPQSLQTFHSKLNETVQRMGELDSLKDQLDLHVPLELIDFVEEGNNPDIFTKDLVSVLVAKNQKTHGRARAIQTFKDKLEQKATEAFPDIMSAYNQVKQEEENNPVLEALVQQDTKPSDASS